MRWLICLLFFYSVNLGYSQCILDYSNYQLAWGDEFNYGPLGNVSALTSKWNLEDNVTVAVSECDKYFYSQNNIKLFDDINGNGFVELFCSKHVPAKNINGDWFERSAARITSKYDECISGASVPPGFFTGIFEIRCKLPPTLSGQSAFWLDHAQNEIDVFEADKANNTSPFKFFTNTHNPTCPVFFHWMFSEPSDDFHTYSLAWTPQRLTWFIDGYEIRSIDNGYSKDYTFCPNKKMPIVASVHAQCWSTGNWHSLPWNPWNSFYAESMIIDYIRVYRPINYPANPGDDYVYPDFKTTHTYNNFDISNYVNAYPNILSSENGLATYEDNNTTRVYFVDQNNTLMYVEGAKKNPPNWQFTVTNTSNVSSFSNLTVDKLTGNVFYRGLDDEVWVYGNWGGAYASSSLDVFNNYPNDVKHGSSIICTSYPLIRIYYENINNELTYYEYNPATNPQWIKHYTGVMNINGKIAGRDNNGVYYRGTDNELWVYYYQNGANVNISMDMFNLYPDNVDDNIASSGNRVYYTDIAHNIWYYEFNSAISHWEKHQSIVSNAKGNIVTRSNTDGCFYIGIDNDVYTHHIFQQTWVYNKMNFLFSDKNAEGYLTANSENNERLFYIDKNNHLRYFEWGTCEVLNPPCNNFSTPINLGLKQTNNENEDYSVLEPIQKIISSDYEILQLYPNPAKNIIHIDYKGDKSVIALQIISAVGQTCLISDNLTNPFIDVSHLKNGLYFFRMTLNNGNYLVRQFVKE